MNTDISSDSIDFRSDNVAGIAPEILEAVIAANRGAAASYGQDAVTASLAGRFGALFETEVTVIPVATGIAANALSIAAIAPPYGAVYCHEAAHIETSEVGAVEFYSGGAKLMTLPGAGYRLEPARLAAAIAAGRRGGGHVSKPAAVSVTQASEHGTLYGLDELREIGALARANGLKLHMDGARFANALAALGCSPADMTWRAGVDILSFGATKNGGMNADAVVIFDQSLVESVAYRARRAGLTWSKMRFASAQLAAYVEDGRFLAYASRANALAARLAAGLSGVPGVRLLAPVEVNEVFAVLSEPALAALAAANVLFHGWGERTARFVCRFDGTEAEVDLLVETVRRAA